MIPMTCLLEIHTVLISYYLVIVIVGYVEKRMDNKAVQKFFRNCFQVFNLIHSVIKVYICTLSVPT